MPRNKIEFIALGFYNFEVMWELKFRILLWCEWVLVETYFFSFRSYGDSQKDANFRSRGATKRTQWEILGYQYYFKNSKNSWNICPISCFLINMTTNHGLYFQVKTNLEFHVRSDEQLTYLILLFEPFDSDM